MSQLDDLNSDVTLLATALGDVATQATKAVTIAGQIQAEIASLQAANPALDLTTLDQLAQGAAQATGQLDTAVAGLAALVPAPAAPPAPSD